MESKNLFDDVYNFKTLVEAFSRASNGKKSKKAVYDFEQKLEENLIQLRDELHNCKYRHGMYTNFIVHDSKKRNIMAAPFRDRVVHHALCSVIEPIFDNGFIYDSYACRRNKGTHKAVARLRSFMRGLQYRETYILKCDISKYFDSVDHDILFLIISKKISDIKTLDLIKQIIDSTNQETRKGIPIGNLTSQLFANIYLNELDQFVKHTLRIKKYIRYMDDFVILDTDKKKLIEYRDLISRFVQEKLKLTLHPNKSFIAPIRIGVDFLGYTIFENFMRVRSSTVRRFRNRMRSMQIMLQKGSVTIDGIVASAQSWVAFARYADTYILLKIMLANKQIPEAALCSIFIKDEKS